MALYKPMVPADDYHVALDLLSKAQRKIHELELQLRESELEITRLREKNDELHNVNKIIAEVKLRSRE